MGEFDKEIDEFIKLLADYGIIEEIESPTSEKMYLLSPEAEKLLPGITELARKELNDQVFSLWQMGMIEVYFDDFGEPVVRLNENSRNEDMINSIEDVGLRDQMVIILSIFDHYSKE